MLDKPNRLQQIIQGMTRVLPCPLTVKVRIGKDDKHPSVHEYILPRLKEWGASAITIHGRTRQQRYTKLANWDYIYKCASESPIPVIGNGDIFSYSDYAAHMAEEHGLAGVMVGRGALIKPWIFTEIKEKRLWDISGSERLDQLKDFAHFGLEHWGSDERGVENTRRFLLEFLSYSHRYVPVGLLEVLPPDLRWRPPPYFGRTDIETRLASEEPEV